MFLPRVDVKPQIHPEVPESLVSIKCPHSIQSYAPTLCDCSRQQKTISRLYLFIALMSFVDGAKIFVFIRVRCQSILHAIDRTVKILGPR